MIPSLGRSNFHGFHKIVVSHEIGKGRSILVFRLVFERLTKIPLSSPAFQGFQVRKAHGHFSPDLGQEVENHVADEACEGQEAHDEDQFGQGESGILDANSPNNVFGPLFPHDPDFGPLLGVVLLTGSLAGELVGKVGLALAHRVSLLFD